MQYRTDTELPALVGGQVGPDLQKRLLAGKDRERFKMPDIANYQ